MRRVLLILVVLLSSPIYASDVVVLTYHDIASNPGSDQYAVSIVKFRQHLDFLKANGFKPISLQQYMTAVRKRVSLPEKSVMLTFDDGLSSYRDAVVPMLKQYGYPSILSVVSGWLDGGSEPPEYRGKLLNWVQLRELKKEPLVEIISHSHNLHRWVTSSPQQTYAPSAITRVYRIDTNRYESEAEFRQRIQRDLSSTRKSFRKELGADPVALTWPYGEYDRVTMALAREAGFRYQLTLDEGQSSRLELPVVRRYMLMRDHRLPDLQAMLRTRYRSINELRFVEFDLDVFAHVSEENHSLLIQQLVDRIGSLGVNAVVVTPFSADHAKTYFPNTFLPMERDLLNGVLDKIQSQLGLEQVYLRFPGNTSQLPVSTFGELARSSRFNAVLFDQPPAAIKLEQVGSALKKYLPEVQLGSWGRAGDNMDLVVIPANDVVGAGKTNTKVLAYVDRAAYLTGSGLATALRALRRRGVEHYGFGSLNYMAGAQAQDDVVEAMAYRLAGEQR